MPLPFRPDCQPAALGVLPHRTASAAWELCLRHLPVVMPLPLLVGEGEDPVTVAAEGFGGATVALNQLRLDRAAAVAGLDDLYLSYLQDQVGAGAVALHALAAWGSYEGQIRRAQALSTVLMGPISLSLRLIDDDGLAAMSDAVLIDALAKHLHLRLRWLQSRLERRAEAVLQWLYEPYIEVVGSPFAPLGWPQALQGLEEAFGIRTGVRGVWVSERTDLTALLQSPVVEVVGIALPLPSVAESWASTLASFIRRRGAIGWGIVPQTVEGLAHARVGGLAARFNDVLQALEGAGLPRAEVAGASLIMPLDTLGHLYPSEAEAVLTLTSQLAGLLRHSYGLD